MVNTGAVFSKAKTVAAAIGSTLTAIMVALTVVQTVLDDGHLETGEYATLFTAALTLAGTVYAVWKTENKILSGSVSAEYPSVKRNY